MATTTTEAEGTMPSAALKTRYSPQEYLAIERRAAFKSEYYAGSIVAMAPVNLTHNLITGSLCAKIGDQFENRPCETYASTMRVFVGQTGFYTYPDVIAVCGEPLFLDDEQDTVLNPTVIIEALSPTTESYDRDKKFAHDRRLASLREYVLVAQDEVLVVRDLRQGDEWLPTELRSIDDILSLPSIDCSVPLGEVYARIVFPEAPHAETRAL